MMKGGSSGEGGVDYMIDYSMLTMGEKIGSGASGEVFTATVDVNPDEEPIVVAVKKLFADTVDKDYFGSAFRRELYILCCCWWWWLLDAALCLFFSCCFIHLFFFFSLLSFTFTFTFTFIFTFLPLHR